MRIKVSTAKRAMYWAGLGLTLFFLFHFESISIGPIKVSHAWKGSLLALLFLNTRLKPSVYSPLFLLALLAIFSVELIENPINAIVNFSIVAVIPLIGVYALKRSSEWSKEALLFLSVFFILSFIPYDLGLLTPLGDGYDLSGSYGVDLQGAIGPFQTVHSASTALAGALVVVLYFLLTASYNRAVMTMLLLLGLYFLLKTYVRTGIAMFAVGMGVMFVLLGIRNQRAFVRMAFFGLALVPLLIMTITSNEALMSRLLGERVHSSEFDSFETVGSGRGALAVASLEIYAEANVFEKFFGMGVTRQKQRMAEKIGRELIPHNGFLSILVHYGLLGIVFFMWFLGALWGRARRLTSSFHAAFLQAMLCSYFIMVFLQQFDMLYMNVLLMLAYAWIKRGADGGRPVVTNSW